MMIGISKEQRKQDEKVLVRVLVVFNLALLGAFVLTCVYQNLA
ncbi:MAG: hypothetical protein SF339_15470 [Blastocatellia bacterium]|nr:hypothetical protein [Blastocatellia bacterium]